MQNHEILINNPLQKKYVLSKLSNLLKNDEITEVIFMVAFITVDGVYLILNEILYLLSRNVKITIITGFMNNFNNPKVLELLLKIDKLNVRMANIEGYHPKLYIIKYKAKPASYIIGSSNLTNNALRRNVEMNLYLEQDNDHPMSKQVQEVFSHIYNHSQILSIELLDKYRLSFAPIKKLTSLPLTKITPNSMQTKALASLKTLRQNGQTKALIISATGSGKTYLSAFDVKAFKAKKLLFVAHRESILNTAINSYHNVINNLNSGKLVGDIKNYTNDFIFSTIQTLCKDEYLCKFSPHNFDYIIIDEVHRAGAISYQKIINYFKPKFLLGMSATPERNDNFNIYQLFDHNIGYEIKLAEALEEGLVCPFHYFGISELMIDGIYLDDYSDFNKIDFDQRVTHIINNLKFYGHDGNKVKGLVFTSRITEAQKLSQMFNQHGYRTTYLSGSTNESEREKAIQLLTNDYTDSKGVPQDYLDYIFSVDIFNEGVDIPCVNQIVLLRPTQSAIIFVQQLGRGLRKNISKEYCVVIDFIGNYTTNFLIVVALSGNNSYNKESLRQFVYEANSLVPLNITVSFDQVTKERLYSSINNILVNKKFIDQKYIELKQKLNHIPTLLDFKHHNSIDPKIIFKYSTKSTKTIYNNYYDVLRKHDDIDEDLTLQQNQYLNYLTQELLFAARPDEIFVLLQLINGIDDISKIFNDLCMYYDTFATVQKKAAIEKILNLETSAALQKKYNICFIETNNLQFGLAESFILNLEQGYFKQLVVQTLELGLSYFTEYKLVKKFNDFILYNRYSRREATRLLNVNLSLETSIYGYRIINNMIPIFITYNKSSPLANHAKYENIFLNNQDFIWYSRPSSQINNNEIQRIIKHKEYNLTILIFLKKSDDEGSEHYYLGNADVYSYTQKNFKNTTIVEFILRLQTPLTDTYFDYFML